MEHWWLCPDCLSAFEEDPGPQHWADAERQATNCGTQPIAVVRMDKLTALQNFAVQARGVFVVSTQAPTPPGAKVDTPAARLAAKRQRRS